MFIKLNYTAGNAKWQYQIWRIVNECINNTNITSIATLQSTATSGGWDSSLLSGLDTVNSTLVRTSGLSTSNTKSHIYGSPLASSAGGIKFTIEFSVHDSLSTKWYQQIKTASLSGQAGGSGYGFDTWFGTSITGGTIASSGLAPTVANGTATFSGTALTVSANVSTANIYPTANGAGPAATIYTAWIYISDTCFVYAFNTYAANTTGFITPSATTGSAGTYGMYGTYYGPIISGQYNRYDDWNLQSNGIYPVVFLGNTSGTTYGNYGLTNAGGIGSYTTNQYQGGGVFYLLTGPTVSSNTLTASTNTMNQSVNSQTIAITPGVATGLMYNGRSTGAVLPNATNAVTTAGTASYYALIYQSASNIGVKVPNATLTAATYAHYPIQWENHYYGMMGGGISEKSEIYLFNGDFAGGDEYTLDGTTYSVWYLFDQITNSRTGISVPKK